MVYRMDHKDKHLQFSQSCSTVSIGALQRPVLGVFGPTQADKLQDTVEKLTERLTAASATKRPEQGSVVFKTHGFSHDVEGKVVEIGVLENDT